MRTTLVIPDPLFKQARTLAHERHQPLSGLVTEAIRKVVAEYRAKSTVTYRKPVRLKTFAMGTPSIDVSNREELFRVLDQE